MCLLAVVDEEPTYAYRLGTRLAERGLSHVSDGTIYPLVGRLERMGLVAGSAGPSANGPARKYYRLTSAGRSRLATWQEEWQQISAAVDACLFGVTSAKGSP